MQFVSVDRGSTMFFAFISIQVLKLAKFNLPIVNLGILGHICTAKLVHYVIERLAKQFFSQSSQTVLLRAAIMQQYYYSMAAAALN